jgi:hypothetical protein
MLTRCLADLTGFEHPQKSSRNKAGSKTGGAESGAVAVDSDLQEIVGSWSGMTVAQRAAVLALLRSYRNIEHRPTKRFRWQQGQTFLRGKLDDRLHVVDGTTGLPVMDQAYPDGAVPMKAILPAEAFWRERNIRWYHHRVRPHLGGIVAYLPAADSRRLLAWAFVQCGLRPPVVNGVQW